jgi:alcohol dehydrogenase
MEPVASLWKGATMNLDFHLYMPTRVLFGCGKLKELGTTPFLPGKKALVVIGASGAMREQGYLDRVLGYLRDNGAAAVVYDRIQANPVAEHVQEGTQVARQNQCDFVVGLGGGNSAKGTSRIKMQASKVITTL